MEFTRDYLIRFAHCDPAGIVFYPQYFVLFNDQVEDWFAQELDCDFARLHQHRLLGVPTVHINCDFANPSRLVDIVSFGLSVEKIGKKSVHLIRKAYVGDDVRVSMTQVLACVSVQTSSACEWPADLRAAMSRFLIQP